jgi:hypothetical protein
MIGYGDSGSKRFHLFKDILKRGSTICRQRSGLELDAEKPGITSKQTPKKFSEWK